MEITIKEIKVNLDSESSIELIKWDDELALVSNNGTEYYSIDTIKSSLVDIELILDDDNENLKKVLTVIYQYFDTIDALANDNIIDT